MNGWLIYNHEDAVQNEAYIKWFIKEAKLQSIHLKLILREHLQTGILNNKRTILYNHEEIKLPIFAVVRTIDPLLNSHLEALGIKTFNSATISRLCNHKMLTHFEINKLNLQMVDTLFFKKAHLTNVPPLAFPFVVKEASGRGGKQVHFIQNNTDFQNCLPQLTTEDLIIQSTNVMMGKDLRVYVIGKEIIGAVLRESSTDFRANFKLGGNATWYNLNNDEIKLIKKIVHSFDFDLVGIDFLFDLNGHLLFNEIEDVVGSRMLSAVSNINLLKKYVSHIKNKCQNKSED